MFRFEEYFHKDVFGQWYCNSVYSWENEMPIYDSVRTAPYCKDKLIKQINDSICYSISFDEALNSIVQKCQMDFSIRYWDDKEQIVKAPYFDSQFLDRPNADNLLDSIKLSTERLRNESLLQLAMDGPNVNWEVLTKLDDKLVEDGYTKTLNIGSCAQHAIHGSFQNGSVKTGCGLQPILKSMFYLSIFKLANNSRNM